MRQIFLQVLTSVPQKLGCRVCLDLAYNGTLIYTGHF